ncbi:phosphotransferase [Deinococcus malanensis]|uniref:phosphotransferase n=1 Tax=Deinococcus malanensis TaxID=1706855 RepID=UPI00363FB80D
MLGKIRARNLDRASYGLQRSLFRGGFSGEATDGIGVPEPLGVIPAWNMWLQRQVPGKMVGSLLTGPQGEVLAGRVVDTAHKLHRSAASPTRQHLMADELRILHERLGVLGNSHPDWQSRLTRLLEACDQLAARVPAPVLRPIHRDFYQDQLIVDGERLWLLDLDLCCWGDPALDIGNFCGHVTELALRTLGSSDRLAPVEEALQRRFARYHGEASRVAVQAYAALTLVRHISISARMEERQPFVGALLELSEKQVGCLL